MEFLFLDARFKFLEEVTKNKFYFWWLRRKMGCWQFLTDFVNFDNICHVILKKDFSFGSNFCENLNRRRVNRPRKDIQITFVSFGLHAGRFTGECTEYENMLFSYFDIFINVSANFTLDSRIAEYLQCHNGLHLLY